MSFKYEVLQTEAEVQEGIQGVALEILEDFPPDPNVPLEQRPLFVPFLKGAIPFFNDLMMTLEKKSPGYNPQTGIVVVKTYSSNNQPSEPRIKLDLDNETPVKDRPVIIVEDLLDTGRTVDFMTRHFESMGASLVKVAALAEKLQDREFDVSADYKAFVFERNEWLVGMGMDDDKEGVDSMRSHRQILAKVYDTSESDDK